MQTTHHRPLPDTDRVSEVEIRLRSHAISLQTGPKIMGILNVTPDSFSDGGLFADPARAEEHALRLEEEGADLIDVGGESTRPGAEPLSVGEEENRLLPVLRRIIPRLKVPVSVDTYKFGVMEKVLDAGASMINDIYGLRYDARVPALLSRYEAAVVIMHMRGSPKTMQEDVTYADLVSEVERGLFESCRLALDAGIDRKRIVIDPGIGFGKSAEGCCELVGNLGRLRENLGFPVCVGLSRKSFLRGMSGMDFGDTATANAALHVWAILKGADILRVHDVKAARQVLRLSGAFIKGWEGDG